MATLTPGELLGVLKGNNAQLLTQISAIFSANSSPAPTCAQSSGNGVTGDQDMDDAWDDEDGEDPTWEDVLPTRGRETRRGGGGFAVADRLANPPPLPAINDIVENHVPYTAVPQAAAPRRNRGDRQLHSLQRKIVVALSLMIESKKDASTTPTVLAAAMLRSAWEDINDTRRRSYAGNQSYKLDPRNDLNNPRLLSPGGKQKVRNGRQKGKGKGKGWQYSWQQQQPQQQRSQGGKGGRGKPWRSNSREPPKKSN